MNLINLNQNKVIVSMGYDSITTSVTLIPGHGTTLPDTSITSYNLVWWNASDYLSPTDDPSAEIVKCIAKFGDTLVIMRSQQQTLASSKNIPGKLYNMAPLPDTNLDTNLNTLSYYNIPQIHGKIKHDVTTIDGGTALPIGQLPTHGIGAHTGTIGTWANIDKTTSSIGDITTRSHTSLTDIGLNSHATIDSHIAATGTSVHGLGTMSIQASSNVSITGGSITGITDIAVADGGTGRSTTVPYAPICGGTTTTDAIQSVASIGIAGQVLTSNGPNTLPTFQTVAGGSDRVLKSGDIMTGVLYLPTNGLVAGTTQLVLYNGNVGIGIDNPMYKLDIRGTTVMWANTDWVWGTAGTGMIISGGTTSGNTYLKIDSLNSGGAANGKLVLNVNGGYVGIGITGPTAKLHIGGTAGVDGIKFPDGTLQTTASTTIMFTPETNFLRFMDTNIVTDTTVGTGSITRNMPTGTYVGNSGSAGQFTSVQNYKEILSAKPRILIFRYTSVSTNNYPSTIPSPVICFGADDNNYVGMQYINAGWYVVSRNSVSPPSTVAVSASAGQLIMIHATNTSIICYVDGVYKGTITSQIPTVALGVRIRCAYGLSSIALDYLTYYYM